MNEQLVTVWQALLALLLLEHTRTLQPRASPWLALRWEGSAPEEGGSSPLPWAGLSIASVRLLPPCLPAASPSPLDLPNLPYPVLLFLFLLAHLTL